MLILIKLNHTNYSSLNKCMIHALTDNNKVGFVKGSIQPPLETKQPIEYAFWNRCDNMILSWLAHSVEPDLAKAAVHAKTVHQTSKKNSDLLDELKTYQTPLICNEMNAQKEEDWMMQFLMGLNSNILKIMSPLPNAHQAYSVAIQDETKRQIALRSAESFSINCHCDS
ncbi:hypothetical protein POTOM_041748 [Populus tomentosa]|uniref:Retrotransposon Copia-like N-terminal domain-containing protein n=1 Tax=Populus tomentosa TaxID=118781 RepID=A0A8X7YPP6_POPTO|nr:hypothetical protein POTOM_041748 [Populus tomentosa]